MLLKFRKFFLKLALKLKNQQQKKKIKMKKKTCAKNNSVKMQGKFSKIRGKI